MKVPKKKIIYKFADSSFWGFTRFVGSNSIVLIKFRFIGKHNGDTQDVEEAYIEFLNE